MILVASVEYTHEVLGQRERRIHLVNEDHVRMMSIEGTVDLVRPARGDVYGAWRWLFTLQDVVFPAA